MAKCKNNFDNLCDRELLEQILRTLQDSSSTLAGEKSHQRLYDNKALGACPATPAEATTMAIWAIREKVTSIGIRKRM